MPFSVNRRGVAFLFEDFGKEFFAGSNAIGGIELYDKDVFSKCGISLNFIKSNPIIYSQFKNEFIPWLSIIDVMMFNSPEQIKDFLSQFDLI